MEEFKREYVEHNPVSDVKWVPVEQVEANNYNPNSVPERELRLLSHSILADGYTQPIVTVLDEERNVYIIVDGFHRYSCMKLNQEIYDRNKGFLPIVVISKNINDRMSSTVRHNRARGKHSVDGMGIIVAKMMENGATDIEICKELGLDADELIRLRRTSGIAELYKSRKFKRSYEESYQVKRRNEGKEVKDENLQ